MKDIEKTIHVFKVHEKDIFYAVCPSLLKETVIQGSSREQIEINIQYFVKNICMRDHLTLMYVIEDV